MSWMLRRGVTAHKFTLSVPATTKPFLPPRAPWIRTSSEAQSWACQRRHLMTDVIPGPLIPPTVFTGLVLGLWFYKCCMMVLFQNKIIYMPNIPPFSRQETLEDYKRATSPIEWTEERINSLDGTEIALCIGEHPGCIANSQGANIQRHVVIVYFQGNASSLPPRLPFLSDVIKPLSNSQPMDASATRYTIVAVSYRGFWKSRGRASQKGIELDAAAALKWAQQRYAPEGEDTRFVLWGQSIGAGVASTAAAQIFRGQGVIAKNAQQPRLTSVILETPFTSLRQMLIAMYPQKWLPYRYLGPFLWNWWDSEAALQSLAKSEGGKKLKFLIIQAANDEVVPAEHGIELERLCNHLGLQVKREVVPGTLHTEAMSRSEGRRIISNYLLEEGKA
ncbi:alpha/beta-hydrolase [Xylona heveae TC161]|uniref:Alpha/beta-hydrolase n=1 Tax=Xylona heveae (strain CBS 132557 / TC161) TaxID=1328760 RepID=A0A165GDG6_XYLHT|nr:alpha/beta-hydrolase [Xylona heveae TC161]KZF22060.1 alpha/beta-hydrolase [Xylona heveae TC161]